MRQERNEELSAELLALLGEEAFLALVEAFGGERIPVPGEKESVALIAAIGPEAARKLQRVHGGNKLNVPLARELRARKYRAAEMDDRQIAKRLGMTVSGVERLFNRLPDRPARPRKGKTDPRQMDFFKQA